MSSSFKLYDFNFCDATPADDTDEDSQNPYIDSKKFMVQAWGINEDGKTVSIKIEDFSPFFYVQVPSTWGTSTKNKFIQHLKTRMGTYYGDSIITKNCQLIKKKRLYGFNAGKQFKFIKIYFKNTRALSKCKNLWYNISPDPDRPGWNKYRLKEKGYTEFAKASIRIYEAVIPPILRLFHIREISPSGWIEIPDKKMIKIDKTTYCDYEYNCSYRDLKPLNDKETPVPYKIMSFDIEADSSHGDFPLPVKTYKRLATNIVDVVDSWGSIEKEFLVDWLRLAVLTAFEYEWEDGIDIIYTKSQKPTREVVEDKITEWLDKPVRDCEIDDDEDLQAENTFEAVVDNEDVDDDESVASIKKVKKSVRKDTVVELLMRDRVKRDSKITEINQALTSVFKDVAKVAGDKVTFIGSTFLNYGDKKPYLNHCIVLGGCSELPNVPNQEIIQCDTEKEVIQEWVKLVQEQDPHIVIGYNITGFDWEYMFRRAIETGCVDDFIKLSRNVGENAVQRDWKTKKLKLKDSVINIASGTHEQKYVDMNGRLQIDLYNVFRREHNLTSYKLDYVSGHFIGDGVKKLDHIDNNTVIVSDNLSGLEVGSWIHFEEISYSVDYYKDGNKFQVIEMSDGQFTISGIENPDMTKKVRWCLAKDDVTPQDIFRLARQGDDERAIVAKYCIQDCNLVHELLLKLDIITGLVEMAKLCSVPMNYLVMRGQGIKLTSYISKKCREKGYLIPCIDKDESEDGYEGAIVLPPKSDLYFDEPVACNDYSSLYPSSMISENLCHSSKVWTKEYDLDDKLLQETGETDENGNYIYDNLPDYKYVNVQYDTFTYVRKTPKAAAQKVKTGYKICRFAEHKSQGKAVIPAVLQELLISRKQTKKLCKQETDPFMKNVYDNRQLAIKLTANSLYGQTGAKTSHFYEPDVAASCTAVGRKLLTYAKRIIEEVYGDRVCETKDYGKVRTKAKYIYGDTDSVFFCFYLEDLEGNRILGKKALEITIEIAQEAGELASKFLKKPHDLEYEKTFLPFCLLSKKRYVGMLFEFDINKGKRKEMGIVLKRRDNAPVVKDVYGGVIDILMKDKSVEKAIKFTEKQLQALVDGDIPIEKLIITKSLRSNYKNPKQIAHKVLADRIGIRDPGNKPRSGDRIPYAYIVNPDKKALQGDRIETPTFIKDNDLQLDYAHYITNQIMKPLLQVFALVLEQIPGYNKARLQKNIDKYTEKLADKPDKLEAKIEQLKEKEAQAIIFDKYIKMVK